MYEVTIEQPENTTRLEIPFDIPTPLMGQGAVELYANRICGWNPKIMEGDVEVDNPLTALNAIAEGLRNQVKNTYAEIMKQRAVEQAVNEAQEQFNAIFE